MQKEITYETLAPLHIGDGNTLNRMVYYLYNGRIYVYEPDDLGEILTKDGKEKLIKYVLKKSGQGEEQPTLKGFIDWICGEGSQKVMKQVSRHASYSCEFWGKEEPKRIWTIIKSRGKPYIPGSEIKGAMRTALLREAILANSLGDYIEKRIKQIDRKSSSKQVIKELEKIDNELTSLALRIKPGDAKYDLLKFLAVSDAHMEDSELVVASVAIKNSSSRTSADCHEFIREKAVFRGRISLENGKWFKSFAKSFRVDEKRTAPLSDIKNIFKACHNMTKYIIEKEIKFYKERRMDDTVSQLEEIGEQNSEDSPVIRIGKHQGFISITLYSVIDKLDTSVREQYLRLLQTVNRRIHANNFPKTRKVITRSSCAELTAGWVKIGIGK
jgi:CRISPR-associated protein Csm5